jgi:hypothetical protein
MPKLLHCPSCGHELHVPENVLGKKIRCLNCRTTFRAEEESPFEPVEEAEATEERSRPRGKRGRALAELRPPAYALIAVGGVGAVAAAAWALLYLTGHWSPMNWLNDRLGGAAKADPGLLEWIGVGITALWAVIPAYSGFKMLRLENHSSVILGCGITLLPVNFAAVVGVPCAIWAITVLTRADVRRAFES